MLQKPTDKNTLLDRIEATPVYEEKSWPDVSAAIRTEFRSPPPPFPLVVLGPWAELIEAEARARSVPVDYMAGTFLATVSSLIGNARWIKAGTWEEPCSLFIGLVGDSSSGKTPAMRPFLDALSDMEAQLLDGFESDMRAWEGHVEATKIKFENWQKDVKKHVGRDGIVPPKPAAAEMPEEPVRPRLKIGDTTVEALTPILSAMPKGILQCRDELAGWYAGLNAYNNGGDRQFYLESFGGGGFTVDRVKNHGKPVHIRHLTMSILGGTQPDKLTSMLLEGDDDGLSARFLFMYPDMAPLGPLVRDDSEAFRPSRPIRSLLDRLAGLNMDVDENGHPAPRRIPLDESGFDPFQDFRKETRRQALAASGKLKSHIGKLPGIALRLALVFEYLSWQEGDEPKEVSRKSLLHALHFIDDYAKPMAAYVYGAMHLSEAERDAVRIYRSLKSARIASINISEMGRHLLNGVSFPKIRDTERRGRAMNVLEDNNVVCAMPEREGEKKGRRRNVFEVNPQLIEGDV